MSRGRAGGCFFCSCDFLELSKDACHPSNTLLSTGGKHLPPNISDRIFSTDCSTCRSVYTGLTREGSQIYLMWSSSLWVAGACAAPLWPGQPSGPSGRWPPNLAFERQTALHQSHTSCENKDRGLESQLLRAQCTQSLERPDGSSISPLCMRSGFLLTCAEQS